MADSPSSPSPKKRPRPNSPSARPSLFAASPDESDHLQQVDGLVRAGSPSLSVARQAPPQSIEAEQAVLGGVLLKPNVFHNLADSVREEDFYLPRHRLIYAAFLDLYREQSPIDLITVSEKLKAQNKLEEAGGRQYLAALAESLVGAANAPRHAEIVRDRAISRRLIETSADIIRDCYENTKVDELLDSAEKRIFQISSARSKPVFRGSKEVVDKVFEMLEQRVARKELVTGIPTDYSSFDEITAGLQPSDLIIVAGRPSMGKTAFALNVGMRAAIRHDISTAVFSLEMSTEQLMMRMLCVHGKIDLKDFRRGYIDDSAWSRLYAAANDLSRSRIFIDDTPALSPLELRARCRRLKAEKGLDLVIVDYLQLMRGSQRTDSREQEISEISRSLKGLAKELHLPVMALSQLNRKAEERPNKRPILSDLRESGAIEQDADVIIFLYRDWVYNKKDDNPDKNVAEIIVGKQRNGPTGTVKLLYQSEFTAFENLAPNYFAQQAETPTQ